ncbi:molybdopterin molybdotransferase MoeA [Rubritalea tangerina]|uniref:Molybdopterin molybdenumtransferase n=1 Tax=Rubritalea tangerina TaxID=430798 RepID=A0ABW4ZBJ9_9BACT
MQPLISPQEAFDLILSTLPQTPVESIPLSQASSRVLREPIRADRPVPPFDRAMMDGIAICATHTTREFAVIGTQAAGMPAQALPSPELCYEIMTGAVLPTGCDCVIPIEQVNILNGQAHVAADYTFKGGDFIHFKSSDQNKGNALLDSGVVLGAPELAVAASVGHTHIRVSKLPKITLLTTGDELVPPSQTPSPFQIRSSHPIAITHAIHQHHLGTVTHHHLDDDSDATESAIERALKQSDLIILTGGVSKGKLDYVAPALRTLCGPPIFHGVSQRPGKPFAYHASPLPVFALPGNPLSVMACLARYILPALRITLGAPLGTSILSYAGKLNDFHLTQLIASRREDGILYPAAPNNSGDYSAIAGCHGVMEFPPNNGIPPKSLTFYPW